MKINLGFISTQCLLLMMKACGLKCECQYYLLTHQNSNKKLVSEPNQYQGKKEALEKVLYQQEIKHFYWSFVYMKLYNNSQKTPQSESPHKVKQNCKTPHQKWRYTQQYTVTVSSLSPRAIWQEKQPKQFYKITEKMSTQKILKQAVDIHKGN